MIPFDQRKSSRIAPRRKKRRWPTVLAVLGFMLVLVVVLISAGTFFWWRHYQTTPAYSLALLVDAGQRNDMAEIDQLVDMDRVISNLSATASDKAAARYGPTLNATMRQRVSALVSVLLPRLKPTIRAELATRMRGIQTEQKPFIVLALSMPYLVNISADGDNARIIATVQDRPVELTMQRNAERWKVSAIKDEQLMQRLIDDLIKDLPAIRQL